MATIMMKICRLEYRGQSMGASLVLVISYGFALGSFQFGLHWCVTCHNYVFRCVFDESCLRGVVETW